MCGCNKRVQYKNVRNVAAKVVGVRPLIVKCSRCGWPTNVVSRYDSNAKKQTRIRICSNRTCRLTKNV